MMELLAEQRLVRWQDELRAMLQAGTVTPEAVEKSLKRDRAASEFLKQWFSAESGATAIG